MLTPLSRAQGTGLAGSDLDVRGWDVRTDLDNEKVGSVDDMLIDDDGRPRYLDVDRGMFKKHVLLPIGQARADARRDLVWVPGMAQDRFDAIPEWDQDLGHLDRDYEERLAAAYRGEEPAGAREGSAPADAGGLRELDKLDGYHIPKEEPNPKGWSVVMADGRKVGSVDELIVDTKAMTVRYLDCDLDADRLGLDRDRERHILIPLGEVRLDRQDKQVFVQGLTSDRVSDLPVYGGLPIASGFEERLRESFRRPSAAADRPDDLRFDERRFYGDRLDRSATGGGVEEGPLETADVARRDPRAPEPRLRADAGTRLDAEATEAEDTRTRLEPGEEVRIRVRGDEVVVEKRPRE